MRVQLRIYTTSDNLKFSQNDTIPASENCACVGVVIAALYIGMFLSYVAISLVHECITYRDKRILQGRHVS